MLLTSLRQERQTLQQNGVTQGIAQTVKRMLNENVDISLITKVTQLSKREILQLNAEQKKKS